MAFSTIHKDCPAGEWTLICELSASVAFQWRSETGYGKWFGGQDEPDPDTLDYATLRPKATVSLNDLSAGDKIWAMPDVGDAALVMEVILP